MSAFGGKADVNHCVGECPLLAISGHWRTQGGRALVADHTAGEVGQDRGQGGPARSVRHVPACRDRDSTAVVRGDPATDRRPAAKTGANVNRGVAEWSGVQWEEYVWMTGKQGKLAAPKQIAIIRGRNCRGWLPFLVYWSSYRQDRPSKERQMGNLGLVKDA